MKIDDIDLFECKRGLCRRRRFAWLREPRAPIRPKVKRQWRPGSRSAIRLGASGRQADGRR